MRKTEDQPTDNASYNGSTGSGKETVKRSRHAPENLSTTGAYRQEIDVVDASRPLQSIGDPISTITMENALRRSSARSI
jgi:hypothetical protein